MALYGRSYTYPIIRRGADDAAPVIEPTTTLAQVTKPPPLPSRPTVIVLQAPLAVVFEPTITTSQVVKPPPLPSRSTVIVQRAPLEQVQPPAEATPEPHIVTQRERRPQRIQVTLASAPAEIFFGFAAIFAAPPPPRPKALTILRQGAPDAVVVEAPRAPVYLVQHERPGVVTFIHAGKALLEPPPYEPRALTIVRRGATPYRRPLVEVRWFREPFVPPFEVPDHDSPRQLTLDAHAPTLTLDVHAPVVEFDVHAPTVTLDDHVAGAPTLDARSSQMTLDVHAPIVDLDAHAPSADLDAKQSGLTLDP